MNFEKISMKLTQLNNLLVSRQVQINQKINCIKTFIPMIYFNWSLEMVFPLIFSTINPIICNALSLRI